VSPPSRTLIGGRARSGVACAPESGDIWRRRGRLVRAAPSRTSVSHQAQGGTGTPHGDETLRSSGAPAGAADSCQPAHQGPRGPGDRRLRRHAGRDADPRGAATRAGEGARPRRGQPQGRAARLQDPRLRQVQVRREEEGQRGQEEAERRRDQGDQAPPQDGRPRSPVQDARRAPLPRSRPQGEVHGALPRPRDHPPREGAGAARLDRQAVRGDRQRRGPPGDGAAHHDPPDGPQAGRDAEGLPGPHRRREGPPEGHPGRPHPGRPHRRRGAREARAAARRAGREGRRRRRRRGRERGRQGRARREGREGRKGRAKRGGPRVASWENPPLPPPKPPGPS
jgi:hypothetical protein